jgi:hypothetical protein
VCLPDRGPAGARAQEIVRLFEKFGDVERIDMKTGEEALAAAVAGLAACPGRQAGGGQSAMAVDPPSSAAAVTVRPSS